MLPDPHAVTTPAGAGGDEDSWSWLVTFSDLVLQLFGFAVIAMLAAGGAARVTSAPPMEDSAPVVAQTTVERTSSEPVPVAPARVRGITDELPVARVAAGDPDLVPVTAPDARDALHAPAPPVPIAEQRRDPRGGAMSALAGYLEHLVSLQPSLAATVRVERDAVVVKIGELAGFAPGSAEPSPAMRPLLAELRALVGDARELHVEVSGHTDDVPIRTAAFPSNLELSLARASRVAGELAGSEPSLRARVSAAGYAEQRPIASNADAEGRARNRRVEIRLSRAG